MNSEETALEAPAAPDDVTLVALTPEQMVPAQHDLIAWCDRKIAAIRAELADHETNLELATQHGWKRQSVANTLNRTAKRIVYYEKMKAALEAGYLLVPNMPVDLFAVRVRRRKQAEQTHEWRQQFAAQAEALPAGEGRYVDEALFSTTETYTEQDATGKTVTKRRYRSSDYDDVDFPVKLVKPVVLEAASRAMALKLFDEMGIVRVENGRDPIVVGRIIDPRGNRRRATFFVAWWVDTAAL
jgi:hypothetical protein